MQSVNPYLNFEGNTEAAFRFYQTVFGGEFSAFQRFGDTAYGSQLPEADRSKLMHIALPLGNGTTLMATDCLPAAGQKWEAGNNFYICLNTDTRAEADQLYNALSDGGAIETPIGEAFWGAYFGSFRDRFGIRWMVSFTPQPH